jgi:hypothetical protein
VTETVEVPQIQIQTVQKVVQEPYTTVQEQIIEVPRVEYQDVEGQVFMETVQAPSTRQAAPGTTRQEMVMGPDLPAQVMQAAAPVQQVQTVAAPVTTAMAAPVTTAMAAPTTMMAAPTTMMAAPTTSYAAAPTYGASVSVPAYGGYGYGGIDANPFTPY